MVPKIPVKTQETHVGSFLDLTFRFLTMMLLNLFSLKQCVYVNLNLLHLGKEQWTNPPNVIPIRLQDGNMDKH